jgi:hypothetical protein
VVLLIEVFTKFYIVQDNYLRSDIMILFIKQNVALLFLKRIQIRCVELINYHYKVDIE